MPGSWELEVRSWKMEAGSRELEDGRGKREVGKLRDFPSFGGVPNGRGGLF